jgi:hypothetical protein
MDRRKFIKTSLAATTAFTILPRFVLGGKGFTPPSDQLTKAVIGVGGMGRWHAFYAPGRLLAVCDVDGQHLKQALDQAGNGVSGYSDFREALERKDIALLVCLKTMK